MIALLFMLLSDGELSAAIKAKLGCESGCEVLSIERVVVAAHADIAVRTRRTGHCGVVSDWTLFDADLKLLLTVDEEVDRVCSGHEEHSRRRVTVDGDRVRAGDRVWRWDGKAFRDTAATTRTP